MSIGRDAAVRADSHPAPTRSKVNQGHNKVKYYNSTHMQVTHFYILYVQFRKKSSAPAISIELLSVTSCWNIVCNVVCF